MRSQVLDNRIHTMMREPLDKFADPAKYSKTKESALVESFKTSYTSSQLPIIHSNYQLYGLVV